MSRVQIEYRVHWCDENGDSCDINFYDGKEWRDVQKIVAQCEAGEFETDSLGLTIGWIERVEHFYRREWIPQPDENGIVHMGRDTHKYPGYYSWEPTEDWEEETLWQREAIA